MFGIPQAVFEGTSERYDGVPVIHFTDSPLEMYHFLKALYFPE